MTKRLSDLILSIAFLVIFSVPMLLIALLVKITSKGPILYWSDRVGRYNKIFSMPKFRTMELGTPQVATHLLKNPDVYLTPIGAFLRKTSMDELPQLFTIIKGDLSLVGPRPALFNQSDLIALRTQRGIHKLMPGLTGWAQINGRDDLAVIKKVELDEDYLNWRSSSFDLKILLLTFSSVLRSHGIKH
jgi:O-antigen biosynthesis protein WbqP